MNRLTPVSRAWRLARIVGDLAVISLAFYLSFLARIHLALPFTRFLLPEERIAFFASEWWLVAASALLLLYFFGFYDPPATLARPERARRLAAATVLHTLALAGFYFLTDREFPRTVLLIFLILNYVLFTLWRLALDRWHRPTERRVALVGSGAAAEEVARKISLRGREVVVAGWVAAPDEPEPVEPAAALGPRLGSVEELPRLLAEGTVDDVILASSARPWQTRLLDRIGEGRPWHSNVFLLPGPVESLIGNLRYRWIEDLPLVEILRPSEGRVSAPVKRVFDFVLGALLVVLTLPVMLFCGIVIAASSNGGVFYRQERIGRDRRRFTVWKFRTMRPDAESQTGEVLATADDPRLTRVGRVLRRLRFDELPQLWNVLAGSMSLVGPRPERPGFVDRYLAEVPGYGERFAVAPGVTGLAQINGDYHSTAENKLRYDLAYIANWSPWLDLSILFRTVKIVLTSRGV